MVTKKPSVEKNVAFGSYLKRFLSTKGGRPKQPRSHFLIAPLEARMLLSSGTPIGIGSIPTTYNVLGLAPLALSTTDVQAGDTLTVTMTDLAESVLTVGCSQAVSATVDGTPTGSADGVPGCYQYDSTTLGEPAPDGYAQAEYDSLSEKYAWDVSVGPGTHTIVFNISPYAPTEGQTMSVENVNPDDNPFDETFYSGPWVVAGGPANINLGAGQYFSSEVPFTISGVDSGISSRVIPSISKTTLPAAAIAGGKTQGNVTVTLANTSATTETGVAKIALYASNDGTIDNSSTLLGMVKPKVNLKADKDMKVTVPVKKLPASLNGDYSLLVGIIDAKGDTWETNSGPSINVGAPFVSLVPSYAFTNTAKGITQISFYVANSGNIASTGMSTITIFTSTDGTASTATMVDMQRISLHLAPAQKKLLRLRFTTAQAAFLEASLAPFLQVTNSKGGTQTTPINAY